MDNFTFQAQGRIVSKKRFGKKLTVRLINDYYNYKTKEDVAQTVEVDFLGKDADHAEQYYPDGTYIQVRGRFENTRYEKDGQTVWTVQHTVKQGEHTVLAFKKDRGEG